MVSPFDDNELNLVARVRDRDADAAEALFVRYAEQLARLADRHLSARVTRRVDGEDVVQSVFRTFFGRLERGEYQIESSAELWRLLVCITLHKSARQGRMHTAAMRDGRLEADGSAMMSALVSQSPEVADALLLNEEIDRAIANLPANQQPHYRTLLELTLAGYSNVEIADRLGIVRRTVERMLERLRSSLEATE